MKDLPQLPSSWLECKLGDVIDYGSSNKVEPIDIAADDWILELEDIEKDTSKIIKRFNYSERLSKSTKNRFASGDVLYGKLRPYLNKVVRADIDGFCSTEIIPLKPSKWLNGGYLFYWLKHPIFLDYVSSVSHGLNMPRLGTEAGRSAPFILAPINEQKRIADKLDALLARVDACREHLDRVPLILKHFRQSVLAAATSGKLTEEWREMNPEKIDAKLLALQIRNMHDMAGGHRAGNAAPPTEDVHDLHIDMFPKGWELLDLRELVKPEHPITYGILKPGPEIEDGVPYIRVADFPSDQINMNTIRNTSRLIDDAFKRSRLKAGDILLSIRGTVGRLVVIPPELENANITQDSARLSIQPIINRDYVLWYLRSELAQRRMRGAIKGVAVRGINIGDVRALQVAIPSREEQDEIVRRVEVLFTYAACLEARYQASREKMHRLTPAILAKAFRGELVPQDPDDEPASVLLERIRTERAVAVGEPAVKRRKGIRKAQKKPVTEVMMLKRQEIQSSHLSTILKEHGPLEAESLWSASQLDIDDFYDQLKHEESCGLLREVHSNNSRTGRLLEVA
ncbi:MAG: hypothetical protein CSYNP_00499 [Syntrophus sp. SKADARSKE-3]|nr:hypothetical protein [Syntrophus sp. SKADARSKE-3]